MQENIALVTPMHWFEHWPSEEDKPAAPHVLASLNFLDVLQPLAPTLLPLSQLPKVKKSRENVFLGLKKLQNLQSIH